MSRLLWNDRGTPDRKKGRDTMGFTGSFAPVTTLFAVQSHLDRSSIHLFAQTHPEVRALAVVSTGREVLQLLQNGLNPQVIVLDMQLRDPGIQTLICGIRAMQLVPKPRLLLSAPTPEQTSAEDALLTFRGQEVILRPYEMRTLFERVYLLGAGDEAAQLYRVRNHCRRILRDMQANPVLSGCTYLERMILFAWSDERDLPIGILYQMAAKDQPVDERAITAAIGRLSRAMQQQGTPLYQQLCVRFGLPQDARRLLLEGVWTSELLAKGGLGLPLIRAYCTAMGWQISQPEGERGLLFTLPTCQAEALGTLHLSAPDTGSTRRRRRLYESELRLYLSAPEEPSDT